MGSWAECTIVVFISCDTVSPVDYFFPGDALHPKDVRGVEKVYKDRLHGG